MDNVDQYFANMNAVREKIKPLVYKWIDLLKLNHWDIDLEWHYERKPDDNGCLASAPVDWHYMSGTINFYLPAFSGCSDRTIESIVVHELLHFIVNEMREDTDDCIKHEERVVSCLTKIVVDLQCQYKIKGDVVKDISPK